MNDALHERSAHVRISSIDLNVDAGESFGRWSLQDDAALVALASSVNVACGFHAGDPLAMTTTVRAALAAGTAIGAHPGYHDLRGFGRRAMAIDAQELTADLLYQVGALAMIVAAEGGVLRHVKPHGALYNAMSRDASVASTVVHAVARVRDDLPIVVQAGTVAEDTARRADVPYLAEAFGDRGYAAGGHLLPRDHPSALLHDPSQVVDHVLHWVTSGAIRAVDGSAVPIEADTLCLHGDVGGAAARLAAVREALTNLGVQVSPAIPRTA